MDNKGQGALEYLLLIGGAVVVAVIVVMLLLGFANQGQETTNEVFQHAMHQLQQAT